MITRRFWLTMILLSLFALASLWACGDDDDDDDNDDDDTVGAGVCYYECSDFINTTIRQTMCYGKGGIGNLATEALPSAEACEAYAREHCESMDYDFEQYYFDTACLSCDDTACEPDWLAEYD